ncbi:hypothetical protein K8I28_04650 [bacterium]|nr:hypothetical protein [bacterium]
MKAKPPKIAIGISEEGQNLRLVKIMRVEDEYRLLAARTFTLQRQIQTGDEEDLTQLEVDIVDSFEIEEDDSLDDLTLEEDHTNTDDDSTWFEVFELVQEVGSKTAVTVAEPQVFYTQFETDWALADDKLQKKVYEEVIKMKEFQHVTRDGVGVLPLEKERICAVVRESHFDLLEQLGKVKRIIGKRLPNIGFIESNVVSLVNLVVRKYEPKANTSTMILHVGRDSSRFIFLRGSRIVHISPLIGDGTSSSDIGNVLFSRLQLEMDSLDLNQIEHIVLSGLAMSAGLEEYFTDNLGLFEDFSEDYKIFSLGEDMLKQFSVDGRYFEDFGSYSSALGAAFRLLEPDPGEIQVDLTPTRIKDEQKKLKMSISGWMLLVALPVIVTASVYHIAKLDRDIRFLSSRIEFKENRLAEHRDLDLEIDAASSVLTEYDRSFTIIDSLVTGAETWSTFLQSVLNVSDDIGGIWFTDIISVEGRSVKLRGFSTTRNRIPYLVNNLHDADLHKVEVHEIRGKPVYSFEIDASAKIDTTRKIGISEKELALIQ